MVHILMEQIIRNTRMNISSISQANGKDPVSIAGFTDDQRKAYESLIDFINKPYDVNDYKRALIGAAGTGNTGETAPSFTGTAGNTSSFGSGTSFSILPPYIVKYCWERTA